MTIKTQWQGAFSGKRVLITGDTGFKGSWLAFWLHELGAEVAGFALPPKTDSDHFKLLGLERIINHTDGDIRDHSKLKKVFEEFKPEYLFHLAAQAIVRDSYGDPKATFDTNVGGSVNVLEAVRYSNSIRSVVFVTSDKCYKNKEWNWGYRENDELGGRDPYSASKAAAELVFSSYLDSFLGTKAAFGAVSVRAGNVIGGGDWAKDRIVPDCIRALQENRPCLVRNPNATRPWQHVLEPLSGYLMMAARMYAEPSKYSGAWNFGPSSGAMRSVGDLVQTIVQCWGSGKIQIAAENNAPHEAGLLHLNCDKAHHVLGWRPRWGFERAIDETVRWYKGISEGMPAVDLTRQQIAGYMEEALND